MMKKLSFRKRHYYSVVVCLSLFAVCSNCLHAANGSGPGDVPVAVYDSPQSPQELKVGRFAPKFTSTVAGKRVSLASYKNQYIALSFWSSLSEESREVNAQIAKLENKYAGSRITFVRISMEENADIAEQYGVSSVPVIYLIGPDGCILRIYKSSAELEQKLNQLF